jgi:hypothetical protein
MAQADPDFDWTTAQPVEEDETSATLTATTFGQRSMPAPTQGPVNIDTEFDWKTATLDEPFDPATAQPISEQEEQQFYQDLEVASRDPQRILTNTEHSLLYDHRQQQDDAVARFFQGAEDVPGNLLSLGMDAGTELRENWFENMFRPDRFAARNLATGMEIGRKAGVQLLQLLNWGQNKVADTIQRGNANDAKMREIAAAVPKTGDERVDGDNVMAAIAKARDEGVFEETPFGPDKEQDYERYLQQNSYARSHAGNITEATMGGKTMTFPNEQTTVFGQQPMQAVSTIGAMGLDITSALPMGAGIFSKLRVLRRLSRVTGMPLPAVERGLAGVADGMEDFGSRVAARVTDKTGLSKTQQVASLAAVSGGAGLLAANTDGMDGVLLPVAAVSGIVPAYKLVGGTIRKTSQAAGTSAMVLREMRAGNIGVVRQAAADDLLRTGTVPPQYAAYMRPYANGVESTLGRVAKNPDNPEITRKLARLADGAGVTQAVRFADDAVSSGIAATLASTPFALLAPDAEQAGAIVGGAATLGTFAGPFAGAFGRSSSRKDADIARMLIDVHAVNGDVPALISLGRDRLGQIAGMQGVVAGKTDFVTLRASDYRANVDVRATGNETGAGVFIEKASNGTARIFINVGEPASMDGKVRVRDRGDGVREVRVRGNDGRTEFIAAPKGRRLLVNDGDTVKAGQQVVDYMPPTRSMPHEIAHAILTSDILDGDIRTDMRNYVTQVYGEDGIKARGREYMAQIVDGDIMFGTHEGAVALTPEEVADVRSGKRTMSDVMKGKPVEAAERDALIDARIDEYNQRSREKGGNDYDWARDEVTAEQFAGEAKGIDFRGIRAGGPKVLESALATSARVLEVLGAKFDRTTGKPLDNPSVLFRDNPLFQSPVLRKRMIEHVRAYNDLLAGLEDAGKRETRGTKVSVDGTPDSAARSPHTKMRPDPDKGGQVGNEFLYVDETGKTQWRSPSEVRAREGSRTSQANTMYNPSRILAPNSTEFGRRTTDSGRTIVSGPTLPAQFDHFVHFPKWMREFARVLEASRERGMTFIADYNAIGDGKDGVYRVRNRGDIRAIQREVAFVGWELTGNKHLKTVLMDLNAFRASAMKAINNGELGIFNNDMQVIEADLRTYLGNHRNGLPGEAGIGQAKRDMLNGLIGTGTAVQRKANPLFSDLNPRGSVRSFRLDRYNDLTPTGREGLSFDYDKINNNRMPQQIPREAQGMPDAVDALTTDQLLRQYEENQGYLGLSTLGMREGRPVRGGAAQTRELLRRNEAISAELLRRGVREEDPQLQRALQRRGQAMPDVVAENFTAAQEATGGTLRPIAEQPENAPVIGRITPEQERSIKELDEYYRKVTPQRIKELRNDAIDSLANRLINKGIPVAEARGLATETYKKIKSRVAGASQVISGMGTSDLSRMAGTGRPAVATRKGVNPNWMTSAFEAFDSDNDLALMKAQQVARQLNKEQQGKVAAGENIDEARASGVRSATIDQGMAFVIGEKTADQKAFGSSLREDPAAPPRVYASVVEGQKFGSQGNYAVFFEWKKSTPIVATSHHHYGVGNGLTDIHASANIGDKNARSFGNPETETYDTLPSGKKVLNTRLLVGNAGIDDIRTHQLLVSIPESALSGMRAMYKKGGFSSVKSQLNNIAVSSLVGTKSQGKTKALTSKDGIPVMVAVQKNRTEAYVLNPDLRNVETITIVENKNKEKDTALIKKNLAAAFKNNGSPMPRIKVVSAESGPSGNRGRSKITDEFFNLTGKVVYGVTAAGAAAMATEEQ